MAQKVYLAVSTTYGCLEETEDALWTTILGVFDEFEKAETAVVERFKELFDAEVKLDDFGRSYTWFGWNWVQVKAQSDEACWVIETKITELEMNKPIQDGDRSLT